MTEQVGRQNQAQLLSLQLESVAQSLVSDPEKVATDASEMLDSYPGQQQALFLLVSAIKTMGAEEAARELLGWMAQEHPRLASIHFELGLLTAQLGMTGEAIEHLSRAVDQEPNHPIAWRALGNQLAQSGDRPGATKAYARHMKLSLRELKLLEDATAGGVEDFAKAEQILREGIAVNPTDVTTIRMLGDMLLRNGRLKEADEMLKRALDLAPDCRVTRGFYLMAVSQLMDWHRADEQLQILLRQEPDNPRLVSMLASNLVMLGKREEARNAFDRVRTEDIRDIFTWLAYGHAARAVGRDTGLVIESYRKCVQLDPSYGTAWWGLADLKTYRFTPEEVAAMREQLKLSDERDGQRCHLEFAYGRALEIDRQYEKSFEHYDLGNKIRRRYITYDADKMHSEMKQVKGFYTPAFFSARKGMGCQAPDPIFIVGMPRAGSTLVEQILASHSQVEGTMELPDLGDVVSAMIRQNAPKKFPDLLLNYDSDGLRRLGEEYLERTRYQRKLDRPFFTDKAGGNFLHTGLIQVILPNAKIIDARRHPLACTFSCFKQAFAPGALHFSYDQTDIARYYRDYVEIMAHYDEVLPGRVHRVIHEELVANPEKGIRALLEFCGLPFEEQCLRSHETDRSVRTSSSHQVRQPIQKKSGDPSEHYEPWLAPMKNILGDILTAYPAVPAFD